MCDNQEDIFVVFGSSELFNDILGITNHGVDFFWFWRGAQLPSLHFCLVLQRQNKNKKKCMLTLKVDYSQLDTLLKTF